MKVLACVVQGWYFSMKLYKIPIFSPQQHKSCYLQLCNLVSEMNVVK